MKGKERAAIRRLRSGVVPFWALERFSVAYDDIQRQINRSLERVLHHDKVLPLFVQGEWGVGKTHLLTYVEAAARQLGVPCASISLDAYSFALNQPQRLYGLIAERLIQEEHRGLRAIVTHLVSDPKTRASLLTFARSGRAGDLAFPLDCLCEAAERGEEAVVDQQYSWWVLLGDDVRASDYTYKKRQAVERLASLARLFHAVGLGGMVVLFDEAETIDQLWNIRSRLGAYSVLGRLCRMPGLWAIFGTTKRFQRTIASDKLRYDLGPDEHAAWFLAHWDSQDTQVISPPAIDEKLAPTLAVRVALLYGEAYSMRVGKGITDAAIADWMKNPSKNPRRLIRGLVERLDIQRTINTK